MKKLGKLKKVNCKEDVKKNWEKVKEKSEKTGFNFSKV